MIAFILALIVLHIKFALLVLPVFIYSTLAVLLLVQVDLLQSMENAVATMDFSKMELAFQAALLDIQILEDLALNAIQAVVNAQEAPRNVHLVQPDIT